MRRRDFLQAVATAAVAIPAGIIGGTLGRKSKAKVSLCFTDSDELLDFIATKSPAAVKVRQDMNDDGSMSWTVLEIWKTKKLPKGWDIKRERDRFNLAEIDRKQGMIHQFWMRVTKHETL